MNQVGVGLTLSEKIPVAIFDEPIDDQVWPEPGDNMKLWELPPEFEEFFDLPGIEVTKDPGWHEWKLLFLIVWKAQNFDTLIEFDSIVDVDKIFQP